VGSIGQPLAAIASSGNASARAGHSGETSAGVTRVACAGFWMCVNGVHFQKGGGLWSQEAVNEPLA
jgi:hypothetical protein